jgi:hypothetical protein
MKKIYLLILFVCAGYALTAQINLSSGLTGYFPLDGNANDLSTTSVNGTNNGASTTSGYLGSPNTAMDFVAAQSDYIDAGANLRGITNVVSLSFWFNTTSSSTMELVEKYNYTLDAGFYVPMIGGKLVLYGRDGSGSGVPGTLSTNTYNDGQWHHVVAIVDQNEWILYVDCQQTQSVTMPTVSPDISVNWPMNFGRNAQGNTNYFDGQLDEIRIYNRRLTTDEICYLCGTGIDLNNQLVGYFPLDANTNDLSTTAVNGTNNGTTATAGFQGAPNTAMDFVATELDYVDAGSNLRGITNQVTVSFWFNTTASGTQIMVEKYNYTFDAGFYVPMINGKLTLYGRDGSGAGVPGTLSTNTYNDGQWHHVVAIVDQTDWILYVDCELTQFVTMATASPDISVNWPLNFGRNAQGNTSYFTGQLDEIRIYNRPLSNTEICNLCHNTVLMAIEDPNASLPVFNIYPNPTTGIVNIGGLHQITGDYMIKLNDITGKQIQSIKNQTWIDLSTLTNGIYFLEIYDQSNHRLSSKKIIKQ